MPKQVPLAVLTFAFSAIAAAQSPAPVDTCKLLSPADAEALVGKLSGPPSPSPAQGSMLGMCDWSGPQGSVNLSARPAREFDDTVKYASRKQKAEAVEIPGAKAFQTNAGLLVQPQGKPYFLQVLAMKQFKMDAAFSAAVARKLKP